MTSVARFHLSEVDALALTDALEGDEQLAALPISFGETDGGHWHVLVFLSPGSEKAEIAALRRVSLARLGENAPKPFLGKLPETDWVAKSLEGLRPVRAGRFLVHGSHDRIARRANDVAIEIDAGQAFGTGHHGTTAGCLLAIDRLVRARPVTRALDVGTGSGVLAIAIAKIAKASVLASDIDPLAVSIARANLRLNGVAGCVRAVVAPGLDKKVFLAAAPYDLIVANILAEPLVALAPQLCRRLAFGGTLILSGLLPNQRARVVAAYRGRGLPLEKTFILDGWLTLIFRRGGEPGRTKPFAPLPELRRRTAYHG